MYIQKITIQIFTEEPREQLVDECNWLLSTYRKNGQIQGGFNTVYISANIIHGIVYCLEANSLDKKYYNSNVKAQVQKIEKLCGSTLQIKLLGTEFPSDNGACSCNKPKSYTLSALFLSRESPLICNDCNKSVPLYKLPKLHGDDYSSILKWYLSSQFISGLETSNLDDEKFPDIPMSMIKALDKQAAEICRKMHKKTGITVYQLSADNSAMEDSIDKSEMEMAD